MRQPYIVRVYFLYLKCYHGIIQLKYITPHSLQISLFRNGRFAIACFIVA